MDTLKGAALILAFLGVIAIFATWIHVGTRRGRRRSSLPAPKSIKLGLVPQTALHL